MGKNLTKPLWRVVFIVTLGLNAANFLSNWLSPTHNKTSPALLLSLLLYCLCLCACVLEVKIRYGLKAPNSRFGIPIFLVPVILSFISIFNLILFPILTLQDKISYLIALINLIKILSWCSNNKLVKKKFMSGKPN